MALCSEQTDSPAAWPAPHPGLLIIAIWLIGFVTFNLPERMSPSSIGGLDSLAIVKIGLRGAFLLGLTWIIASRLRLQPTFQVIGLYLPLFTYVAWAFVTTAWSPLKMVTLGQSMGQCVLLAISIHVALSCRNAVFESRILGQLCLMLAAFSLVAIALHYLFPDWAALSRDITVGVYHPTNVASAASLGLLLVLACALVFDYAWARWLMVFAIPVHLLALILSGNRLSLLLDAVLATSLVVVYANRVVVAGLTFAGSLAVCLYLTLDPGLRALDRATETGAQYVVRGQAIDQFYSLSGREEMWTAMWHSFLESPVTGHGYFVSSSTGQIDVWNQYINHTAHNLVLQALVATGLVGLILFAWWNFRLLRLFFRPGVVSDRRYLSLFVPFAVWTLFWSMMNEAYLGPLRPESITYAVIVGVFMSRVVAARGNMENESVPTGIHQSP